MIEFAVKFLENALTSRVLVAQNSGGNVTKAVVALKNGQRLEGIFVPADYASGTRVAVSTNVVVEGKRGFVHDNGEVLLLDGSSFRLPHDDVVRLQRTYSCLPNWIERA